MKNEREIGAGQSEKPKRPKAEEVFRADESFRMLREEIADSVREALSSESGEKTDVLQFQRFIEKKLLERGYDQISELEREKLFWGYVFEQLGSEFATLNQKLSMLADKRKYSEGEQEIKKTLLDLIRKVSPDGYASQEKRGWALSVFKNFFNDKYPDIKELFNAQAPEEKEKAIRERLRKEKE